MPFEMKLPHVAFHRQIGEFSGVKRRRRTARCSAPRNGRRGKDEFLPSAAEGDLHRRR